MIRINTTIKIKSIAIFLGLICSLPVLSQKDFSGYFGSRLHVQAVSLHRFILFNREGQEGRYDFGLAGNITYQVKRNLGLQFEIGREFFNPIPSTGSYTFYNENENQYQGIYINNVEAFRAKSIYFMPKLVFSSSNSIQPMGFSNEVGFGFHFGKLINDTYRISWNDFSGVPLPSKVDMDFSKLDATKYYSIFYALNYHIPMSKKLLLGFHFQYMAHLGFPKRDYDWDNTKYKDANSYKYFTQTDHNSLITKVKRTHFATFGFGLCYAI